MSHNVAMTTGATRCPFSPRLRREILILIV
jgi:hypothetical protein